MEKLTVFEKKVLNKTKKIPKGRVSTYKLIAKAIGKKKASRAVGNALNKNPFPIKVPCHRVVKSNGEVGGFALGKRRKIALLKKEGIKVRNGKILDFERVLFSF